jgi:Protein of unknown function (DUF3531)
MSRVPPVGGASPIGDIKKRQDRGNPCSRTFRSPLPAPFSPLFMQVQFREFSQFDVWFWLEFNNVPSEQEKKLVEEVFSSWFFLGKLGGFNAENSQVQETGLDLSYMDYDNDASDRTMMSLMHNMGDFEYEGNWGRCWLDLGTSDAIAIDILINSLNQLSKEYVEIHQLIIGGENDDWEIDPSYKESLFQDIN